MAASAGTKMMPGNITVWWVPIEKAATPTEVLKAATLKDPAVINRATATLAGRYDYVLLEGAGGLAVPLDDTLTTLDFIRAQAYPVVLVTSGRLGSINHTLLSLSACRQQGIAVEMLIYNRFPPADPLIEQETAEYLQRYLRQHFPQTAFEYMDGQNP